MTRAKPKVKRPSNAWVKENYPNKHWLSYSEAMGFLKNGPQPAWFKPWAVLGVFMLGPGMQNYRYGYVHNYGGDEIPPQHAVRLFVREEDLNWGLEIIYKDHLRTPCDACQGVSYFAPDVPIRLRMIIEQDDDE